VITGDNNDKIIIADVEDRAAVGMAGIAGLSFNAD
jgi:hypothetical protein